VTKILLRCLEGETEPSGWSALIMTRSKHAVVAGGEKNQSTDDKHRQNGMIYRPLKTGFEKID